jgi:hypothetical protein
MGNMFRETKKWKFKKFRIPTDEIYKETPGNGRGTHISQLFEKQSSVQCKAKSLEICVSRQLSGVSL